MKQQSKHRDSKFCVNSAQMFRSHAFASRAEHHDYKLEASDILEIHLNVQIPRLKFVTPLSRCLFNVRSICSIIHARSPEEKQPLKTRGVAELFPREAIRFQRDSRKQSLIRTRTTTLKRYSNRITLGRGGKEYKKKKKEEQSFGRISKRDTPLPGNASLHRVSH